MHMSIMDVFSENFHIKIITGSSQKKMTASGPLTLKSSQAIKARDLKC